MSKNTFKTTGFKPSVTESPTAASTADESKSNRTESATIATPKASWGGFTAIIVAIAIYFIAVIVSSTTLSLFARLHHWSAEYADNWLHSSIVAQFFYVLINEVVTVLLLWAFVRIRKYKNFIEVVGLKSPQGKNLRYIVGGLAVYFFLYVITANLAINTTNLNPQQQQEVGFSVLTTNTDFVLAFISLVLLPPVVEEIMFRGFLFAGLRRKFKFIIAALVTSAVFALPHLFETSGGLLWMAGIDTFILSLVLCYVREKTGTVWAGMIIHGLKNFVAFYILFLSHNFLMR